MSAYHPFVNILMRTRKMFSLASAINMTIVK